MYCKGVATRERGRGIAPPFPKSRPRPLYTVLYSYSVRTHMCLQLMWKKRGMDRGALLRVPSHKRPPEPLWLFIDLHGIINEVQIVESGDGDPTSSSSVSELQRSRSTLSDQALAEQLSTTLALGPPAATSYASSSRPAPKMTNSSSLFESEWDSFGAEERTLSSLRTAESSSSRGGESSSSCGSESSRSRGGESSRSSGSAGGSSNLSQSNLFESNFLYDEFMGARTKMNLAYKTAPVRYSYLLFSIYYSKYCLINIVYLMSEFSCTCINRSSTS